MKLLSKILCFSFVLVALSSCEVHAFRDDFNRFNYSKWGIGTWQSPASDGKNHVGIFVENNVEIVDGYLRLELRQKELENGTIVSQGSEIHSLKDFGYGTYEFRMRASNTSETPDDVGDTVTGSVSAAFVYAPEAITEIDIEFEGSKKKTTHFLTWEGENNPNEHSPKKLSGTNPHEKFYVYKIEWFPEEVRFYRDDELIKTHRQVVPSTPGRMTFNHWGTNSKWWGGYATPGVSRYVFIDYFKFTPLK